MAVAVVNFFVLTLAFVTLVCAIIWLLERHVWMPARYKSLVTLHSDITSEVKLTARRPVLVSIICMLFPVILYVFLVRSFFFEIYKIPTKSMLPAYKVGTSVLIDKFAYGVSDPLFHNILLYREKPEHGDVAVFMLPDNPGINYIKRIVGVPGDTVVYRDKVLSVESKWLEVIKFDNEVLIDESKPDRINSFFIQKGMEKGIWKVPAGQYFVIGDNRDDSQDSRFWGFVPQENLVGKVIYSW
ncbi:signal peptidase I [Vibrio cholerae]|nr:signal peptidase I [Vibrio cholerae]